MKKITLLLIAMLGLSGCPGKSGGGGNSYPINPGLVGGCPNCQFSPAAFSQPVTATIPQGTMTLQIAGDGQQMNMWAYQGQNPLFIYQGPISVTGTLMLNSALTLGMCVLPAGQYQLNAVQAGNYSMGMFQIPMMQVFGPVQAAISLVEGTVLTNGNGSMMSFGAMIFGQQGPSMMMGGYGMPMGGVSGCMDSVGVRF